MRPNPFGIETMPRLAWLIVPIAWLVARPYRGVRHDGVLYLGQSLRHLWPDTFSADVFFAHGSQDSYSVFAWLSAILFERFGVAPVESLVPLAAHALLLLASFWLIRLTSDFTRFESWLALIAVVAFPHLYDGLSLLAFAEPFLTARTIAEPLAVLALCLLLSRRWLACAAATVCSLAFHPLITFPVVVVAWLYLCLDDRRWLWAAALVVIPVATGLAGIAPFDKLFLRYDALWWANVEENNSIVLLAKWLPLGWQNVVFDLCMLGFARVTLEGRLAKLCSATLFAALLLMAVSGLGADVFHNVLVTSLQFWRVMWWVQLLTLLTLPVLITRMAQRQPHGTLVASALLLAAVGTRWSGGWVLGIWVALALFVQWRRYTISPQLKQAAVAASLIASIAICVVIGQAGAEAVSELDGTTATSVAMTFLTTPIALVAGSMAMLLALRRHGKLRAVPVIALVLFAGAAVANWDRRSEWQRFIEASLNAPHPFQQYIGTRQQVYWHDQLQATWLILKRPSYSSDMQAAGQLFNRGTMEETYQRGAQFKGLRMQEIVCSMMATLNGSERDSSCSPTLDLVEEICNKQAGLDFMIFDVKLPRGIVDQWTFNPPSGRKPTTYYLYACNKLRSS